MQITPFRSFEELTHWADPWNQLARGIPFRSWEWNTAWWRHYANNGEDGQRELYVLAAHDGQGELLGVAPWYLERSATKGNVLQFVGTGAVCPEYLTILCKPGQETGVTGAFAAWLFERLALSAPDAQPAAGTTRWDVLELSSVAANDRPIELLTTELAERGCSVYSRPGMQTWRLELSRDWETYLARMSKPGRNKARKAEKNYFATGRAKLHTLADVRDFPRVFNLLVELHQKRRRSMGYSGCFASSEFTAFHREFAERMLARGALVMQWLELDGKPAAIEYQLFEDNTLYTYQSGVDPDLMEDQPGHLASIATLRQATEQGVRAIDFLRGDEPYKAHWRAEPQPVQEISVVPPTATARLRFGVRAAGDSVKNFIKSGLELTGMRPTQA